jgi:hypothetical protein
VEQSGQEKIDVPAIHGEAVVPEIWENMELYLERASI